MKLSKVVTTAAIASGLIFAGIVPATAAPEPLLAPVSDIESGKNYVFIAEGAALSAAEETGLGATLPGLTASAESVSAASVWKATEIGDQILFESAAHAPGENFLNLTVVDGVPQIGVGAAQPLEVDSVVGGQQISATTVDAAVALTAENGTFAAATDGAPTGGQLYEYTGDDFYGIDPVLDGETPFAGQTYVISLVGVLNAGGTGFSAYENRFLQSEGSGGRLNSVAQFADTDETAKTLPFNSRWVLEGSDGDCALRTQDGSGYLQLSADGAAIGTERQSLNIAAASGDRFTITATVDGVTHHLDWDASAKSFTTTTAGSSNSKFSIAAYDWGVEDLSPVDTVPFSGIVEGETYVFAHLGIYSVGNNGGAVALSNESNGNPTPKLMRGDRFSTIRDTAPESMQWRAERFGEGWALQALSYPGQYLNLDATGAYLGNKQEIELLEGANGTVKISQVSANGTRLYIRFTGGNGNGWQAGTADGSNTFTLFTAPLDGEHPLPPYAPGEDVPEPETPIDESLIAPVSAAELEMGKNYILAIPGIGSSDKGTGTFTLSSESVETNPGMREHKIFENPGTDLSFDMVWKIDEFGDGYSLESPTIAGENRFLNISGGQLTMGPRQSLELLIEGDTVRVSRTVNGETFNVRFTTGGGNGWQAATPWQTSNFTVWEYTGPESFTNGLVDSRNIVDGGEYGIVLGGVLNTAGTGWSKYTAYGLTSNEGATEGTLSAVGGINADTKLGDGQLWIIERYEAGYSLRASDRTGEPLYLTISGEGDNYSLELSTTPQALKLDRHENGLVSISVNSGAQSFAFQSASTSFGVTTGSTNDQLSIWERRWSLEPLTNPKRTDIADLQNGQSYVFAAPNIYVIGEQFMTTAITGESNGNVSVGLMDSAAFGLTDPGAPEVMQWRVAKYNDGYSMQSLATPTADGYLNIEVIDGVAHASLGARQELDLVANGMGAQITRVIDGTRYYLRYTAGNGHGWHAATSSSSSTFRIYETPVADLSTTLPLEPTDGADLDTNSSWAFVLDGALEEAPGALSSEAAATGMMTVQEFFPEEDTIDPAQRWSLVPYGNGYAMLAEGAGGNEGFLNVSSKGLTLGKAQELQVEVLEDGTVRILGSDSTQEFGLGIEGGEWVAVNPADAVALNVYRINFPATQVPDEPTERPAPDYTIAGISDMHVDYGWQSKDDPIRESTREATERIRTEEQPDLVLQGGDAVSDNGKLPWPKEDFDHVIENLESMLTGMSDSGQVLGVNGNHDYEVGLTEWNSGEWIDELNQQSTGDYTEVLYEGAERDGNLAGYVTEVDGIKVIALSTPYNGDWTITSYHYTLEQVEWFEEQMAKLDKDEFAITFTHYPLQDHRGGTGPGYGINNGQDQNDRIKAAMLPFPNVLHLYGHDHGGPIVETDAFEKVTQYSSDGSVSEIRGERTDSFTSVYLGSPSYYNNRFNPGWLGATNPAIVQPLMVYLYEDRIEFEYKNYGAEFGERQYPYTYAVPFVEELASSELEVANGTISSIPHETTVGQLESYFETDSELVVRDFTGEMLVGDREIRSDYTVEVVGTSGIVQSEYTTVVNAAALASHEWTVEEVRLADSSGETTYALSEAAAITGATLSARSQTPPAGNLVVGVYDADGQYVTSTAVPVTSSGDVELSLAVADAPEGAIYRAYVVDAIASAKPLSEPLSSDGEKPLAANIPTSAETELVMGMDQATNSIKVFQQNAESWDAESALAWSWKPTDANGFDATRSSYTSVTDAKVRWNDFYDDYVVVTTASGGFIGLFDYATGEKLYESELKAENNPHSVEVLPDGNIVAASSSGNSVTIYAATEADPKGWHQQYELPDAHAVNWDPDMNVLWAAGTDIVQGYELSGTREEPTLTAREDMKHIMPEGGAHDMYVVYGVPDTYWLSGGENIFQFNARTGEFSTEFEGYDVLNEDGAVKGLGAQPYTGNFIRIHPNFERFPWNSDSIRLFVNTPDGYVLDEQFFEKSEFYKSRPWYPRYE